MREKRSPSAHISMLQALISPSFELGDDRARTGCYTMTFDVVNITNETKVYNLSVSALTESAVCGRVNPDHTS